MYALPILFSYKYRCIAHQLFWRNTTTCPDNNLHPPKGFGNFIAIYNSVITARILLSWFPQAQGIGFLQPVYQITDPYLNLFRGIIPPIFGLDFSPILAFVTLNLLQSSAVSLAADIPKEMREKLEKERWGVVGRGRGKMFRL